MEIKDLIYTIRGKQVMLDSDLAKLFECANGTKSINLTVKRNIKRFPEDFCFKINVEEKESIQSSRWFQFETTLNKYRRKDNLPFAFTEQGIIMLSSLLKSEKAIEMSINISKIFIEMRKFILSNSQVFERLTNVEYKLLEHDEKFNLLFNELQNTGQFNQKIFYNGQIYDAYSLIIDIIKKAKKEIILIDNYIDKSVLDLLSKKNNQVEVTIITKFSSELTNIDIKKFNEQYYKLSIEYSDKYHDRFLIIDNKTIYHIGASLKDAGKKCFAINRIEDKSFIERIFNI